MWIDNIRLCELIEIWRITNIPLYWINILWVIASNQRELYNNLVKENRIKEIDIKELIEQGYITGHYTSDRFPICHIKILRLFYKYKREEVIKAVVKLDKQIEINKSIIKNIAKNIAGVYPHIIYSLDNKTYSSGLTNKHAIELRIEAYLQEYPERINNTAEDFKKATEEYIRNGTKNGRPTMLMSICNFILNKDETKTERSMLEVYMSNHIKRNVQESNYYNGVFLEL